MVEVESTEGLGRQAREFVGVGASVGARCHPCVTHHLKAGTEWGLRSDELLGAIAAAERVSADASARMSQHSRRQLTMLAGDAVAGGAVRDATLAALGAAITNNSMPNIERYLSEASELGVSLDELAEAVHVAQEVQANAARIHARLTAKLLDALGTAAHTQLPNREAAAEHESEACADSCPCHDETSPPEKANPSGAAKGQDPPVTAACGDAGAPVWGTAAGGTAACTSVPATFAGCCASAPA